MIVKYVISVNHLNFPLIMKETDQKTKNEKHSYSMKLKPFLGKLSFLKLMLIQFKNKHHYSTSKGAPHEDPKRGR